MIRVAINGFGRMGRAFFRLAQSHPNIIVVAVNDKIKIKNLAYLLQYDSIHKKFESNVIVKNEALIVNGNSVKVYNKSRPIAAWLGDDVDVVIEATGRFRTFNKNLFIHLLSGAKKVIVTSNTPQRKFNKIINQYIYGVNHQMYRGERIISASSCSANCSAPVILPLSNVLDIESVHLASIHSYTTNQRLLDTGHPTDFRRGRAAALNIVPSPSNAATSVARLFPALNNRVQGSTLRVPVADGSMMILTFKSKTPVSKEYINGLLKASAENELKGILKYTEEEFVSKDIIDDLHAAIVDARLTDVVNGKLIRVVAWYDHEYGYTNQLINLTKFINDN